MRRISRLAFLATLLPAPAFACAVCAGGNPANRFAFFIMTIVMSLLPLALFVAEFGERDAPEAVRRPMLVEPPARDAGALHSPPTPAR